MTPHFPPRSAGQIQLFSLSLQCEFWAKSARFNANGISFQCEFFSVKDEMAKKQHIERKDSYFKQNEPDVDRPGHRRSR